MSEEHIIARQFLVQTGIQELLDMDDVTEIAVNQLAGYGLKVVMVGAFVIQIRSVIRH